MDKGQKTILDKQHTGINLKKTPVILALQEDLMPTIIEVKNLVKRYRNAKEEAISDISFSLGKGEFFALLGPNGAGKTTTLSILTTTLQKTSGEVRIAGHNVETQQNIVRQKIGVIFQWPTLDLNLTAEENIRFHAILYGIYPFRPAYSLMPASYKEKIKDLASLLGIEKDMFRPIKTLSGGMKRKFEIVRSLMHNPKILFLDEPTTGLDPESRKNLWGYLQGVRKKEKTTIFLTTHYLEEAEDADRIAIINHGKIVSYGTPTHIKKDLVDEYLLLDANDRNSLRKELEKMRLPINGEGPFKVGLKERSAQSIIKSLHSPLTFLKIHTPSLEEAYLEIIRDDERM